MSLTNRAKVRYVESGGGFKGRGGRQGPPWYSNYCILPYIGRKIIDQSLSLPPPLKNPVSAPVFMNSDQFINAVEEVIYYLLQEPFI